MAASSTKSRILDASEGLFAEHGFDGTSLRAITTAADVNLAAVHYHFGSKEALLLAVVERRMIPINEERLANLDRLEAGPAPPSLEAIVAGFLRPAFRSMRELGDRGVRFVRLLARMHTEANPQVRRGFIDLFEEVAKRYTEALARVLPELTPVDLHWRIHFMIGAMAHTLMWGRQGECIPDLRGHDAEPDAVLESLIRFCIAGMRSPATTPVEGGVR